MAEFELSVVLVKLDFREVLVVKLDFREVLVVITGLMLVIKLFNSIFIKEIQA